MKAGKAGYDGSKRLAELLRGGQLPPPPQEVTLLQGDYRSDVLPVQDEAAEAEAAKARVAARDLEVEWRDMTAEVEAEEAAKPAKKKGKLDTTAKKSGKSVTKADSKAEDIMWSTEHLLPFPGPWVGKNLYIAQTLLTDANGLRLKEYGLFTSEDIKAGSYLGAYSGTFMPAVKFNKLAKRNKDMKRHAVQLVFNVIDGNQDPSQMLFILPQEHTVADFVKKHPMQMMNEPPEGGIANTTFLQHRYDREIVKSTYRTDTEWWAGVLVYATTDVEAGEELYIHYGTEYAEVRKAFNYTVGSPAPYAPSTMKYSKSPDDVVAEILKATKDHPLGDDNQILFKETAWEDVAEENDYKRETAIKRKKP